MFLVLQDFEEPQDFGYEIDKFRDSQVEFLGLHNFWRIVRTLLSFLRTETNDGSTAQYDDYSEYASQQLLFPENQLGMEDYEVAQALQHSHHGFVKPFPVISSSLFPFFARHSSKGISRFPWFRISWDECTGRKTRVEFFFDWNAASWPFFYSI